MPDENCKYYKSVNNLEKKYCVASSRLSGREEGDYGELINYFPCAYNNHKQCEYFLQENKFNK